MTPKICLMETFNGGASIDLAWSQPRVKLVILDTKI